MGTDKTRLSHHGKADPAKNTKNEIDNLKRIIGELTIANDILKKLGGKQKLTAVKQMQQHMSLAKSLKYTGVSKCAWYYKPKTRMVRLNKIIVDTISKISIKRHT